MLAERQGKRALKFGRLAVAAPSPSVFRYRPFRAVGGREKRRHLGRDNVAPMAPGGGRSMGEDAPKDCCRFCHLSFKPSRFRPDQSVRGQPLCQRRAEYHRRNIDTDPIYAQVVNDSQKNWPCQYCLTKQSSRHPPPNSQLDDSRYGAGWRPSGELRGVAKRRCIRPSSLRRQLSHHPAQDIVPAGGDA
jgi:hypothetical protein